MSGAPIRLLMTADAVGGVWQYASDLASGLAGHGFETVLAVMGPPPAPKLRDRSLGNPAVRLIETGLPLDWLSDAAAVRSAARRLADLAQDERADLIHLNSPALAADQRFGVPVLGVAHGCLATWWEAARPGRPLDPAFIWHREMMMRGLRACDRIVAPSASYADCLKSQYRLPTAPLVVHNGRAWDPDHAHAPQHDCAFTAGRLWDEVKNTRTLDAVAARLPFPFYAAGQRRAPQGGEVELRHLQALGPLDSDALTGWLSARPVFVSAATFEPFGLAVLEAAMSGCALVLSDIPTFRELWDGAASFVPAGDERGFAEAIAVSVEDLAYRHAMGEAAQAQARRYSAERMAAAMAAHYLDLLGGRAAA